MSASNPRQHRDTDRLSAESSYALLSALTVIKAQEQMIGRWVRRTEVPDGEMVLGRLATIDRLVGQLTIALDAMPAAEASGSAADAERGDAG